MVKNVKILVEVVMLIKAVRTFEKDQTKGDITKISNIAKERKMSNPRVVDGTIGALYNDDGHFFAFKSIDNVIDKLQDIDKYPYAPINGGAIYQTQVLQWVFGPFLARVVAEKHLAVCATPGGTGALSIALYHYLDINETLLIPDLNWPVYEHLAKEFGINVSTYHLFRDDCFNIEGFIEAADAIVKKEGKLVTIINNPNHNPTGFSMTYEDLYQLGDYFKRLEEENIPVVFIYDVAYIDYWDYQNGRKGLNIVCDYGKNVLTLVTFSASKSFGIYGMRLGALIAINQEEKVIEDFRTWSTVACRTRWGTPNRIALSIFNQIVTNKEDRDEFMSELKKAQELLFNRSDFFIRKVKEYNIPIYPYQGGFFAIIKVQDSLHLYEYLKDLDIFGVPFDSGFRLALSSMSIKDIDKTLIAIRQYFEIYRM